jgi:hypothetical protein
VAASNSLGLDASSVQQPVGSSLWASSASHWPVCVQDKPLVSPLAAPLITTVLLAGSFANFLAPLVIFYFSPFSLAVACVAQGPPVLNPPL